MRSTIGKVMLTPDSTGKSFISVYATSTRGGTLAIRRIVRSTFDEALTHFPNSSIDLLHLDGQHFYENVKHDFEGWRPKLSDRAVVLFHDTNVREREFGVVWVWQELQGAFPSFEFLHGHGLGVLGYGANLPKEIAAFFAGTKDQSVATEVRQVYNRLGATIKAELDTRNKHSELIAKFSEQEARSREFKARLEECETDVRNLVAKLQAEESRRAALKALADEFKTEAKKLRNFEVEIKKLRNSISWRITAPLRVISMHAGWALRNIRQRRDQRIRW